MKKVILYLIINLFSIGMFYYASIVWVFTVMTKRVGDNAITVQDLLISFILLSIIGLFGFSLIKIIKEIFFLIKNK